MSFRLRLEPKPSMHSEPSIYNHLETHFRNFHDHFNISMFFILFQSFLGVHGVHGVYGRSMEKLQVLVETGDLTDAATCRKLLEKLQGCISIFHLAGARYLRNFSRQFRKFNDYLTGD